MKERVIVIGGGAAGFFGAINCARKYPHTQVTLLEAGRVPLSKVRISGGGRCNVTHHCFEPAQLIQYYPRGAKALRGAFTRFNPQDTINWFNQAGVKLKTEADGRMFPVTNTSETIVECLLQAAAKASVTVKTQSPVQAVSPGFKVLLKGEEELSCDRLLLATGSSPLGYRWAKDLGHQIEQPVPSLFTFNIKDSRLEGLAGVSVELASLCLSEGGKTRSHQVGPLLVTHWGLSGPAVLKLSAWAARLLHQHNYKTDLIVNWLPQYQGESLKEELLKIKVSAARKQIQSNCPFKQIPKRLWQRLTETVGVDTERTWAELSKVQMNKLLQELQQGRYSIGGKGVFKEEFVTCGGVSLAEIDFKTMQSKVCPGLYFAGEILDIDGVTGGFNFQSAWTTGWIAGESMCIALS